jgi:hypothetical protein
MATTYEQFRVSLDVIGRDWIPSANVTYDLGHNEKRWKDLYLSGSTIYIGDASISSTGGAINLPSGTTVGGSSVTTAAESGVTDATAIAYAVALG